MEDVCCTSSDSDMEGLRWRQGHKPHAGPSTVTPAPHQGAPDSGDDGLSMSKYLLGALAMVAVGLLVITGKWGSHWLRPQRLGRVQTSPSLSPPLPRWYLRHGRW